MLPTTIRDSTAKDLSEAGTGSETFVAEARKAISDLFHPRAFVYWADLLLSASIGWGAFAIALRSNIATWTHSVAFFVAVFALYRAVTFTHELVHLRRSAVPGFRTAWRLLCGIPLLVPHFLYRGVHLSHHRKTEYGTAKDGEYFPFANRAPGLIFVHLAWNIVLPLFALLRFTILGIASAVSPKIYGAVARHASSMTLRMRFSRELPSSAEDIFDWKIEDASCTVLATTIVILTLSGVLSPSLLCHWYALMASIALANSVRAIGGTHRYRRNDLEASLSEQGADSVNIESKSIATLLACPLGLRFHALHHLFPTIPYHSLGAAHRRLLSQLPGESPYRSRSVSSVWAGGSQVWRDSRAFSSSPVTHSHSG